LNLTGSYKCRSIETFASRKPLKKTTGAGEAGVSLDDAISKF